MFKDTLCQGLPQPYKFKRTSELGLKKCGKTFISRSRGCMASWVSCS